MLVSAVTVDDTGQVSSIRVAGTILDRAQHRARDVTAGRESDLAIADALRDAGARFVPNRVDDLRTLIPAGLHRRLGTPVIRRTAFRSRAWDEGADEALTWRVELDRQEVPGVLPRYTMVGRGAPLRPDLAGLTPSPIAYVRHIPEGLEPA